MSRVLAALLVLVAAALLAAAPAGAAEQQGDALFTADGYRREAIRSPTPATVPGGKVIHTDELARLIARQRVGLIDVLPAPMRPAGLPEGTLWMPTERRDIPGSLWLPGVGMPVLSDALAAYFAEGLSHATGGDRRARVVIYCQKNCWLSWNAAKRAASLGYRHVLWYPDGTDGWVAAGHPTERVAPQPMPGQADAGR